MFSYIRIKEEKMANELSSLSPAPGSRKAKTRLGRGEGSGKGRTAGRGMKGQYKRSTVPAWFEGGQMPIHRRLPKRGFNNNFAKDYFVVDLSIIASFFSSGDTVSYKTLAEKGLLSGSYKNGVKVLGDGSLDFPLTFVVSACSASALSKITESGGTAQRDPVFLEKRYATVKIGRITANFEEGSVVTAEDLLAKKLISDIPYHGVWVVGGGKCGKLTIQANKFSSRVQSELKRSGGVAKVVDTNYGTLDF
jgi:large subunit ribosomal protein L15